MEIWKDVIGYEELYEISNLGNIKSLAREVNNRGTLVILKERILKPSKNNGGYLAVCLSKECKIKTKSIHQMVAESFLNHVPNGKNLVVNHKNFIRTDNRVENLEIVTFRENTNKKHLKSSSKHTGVCKFRNKWMANIRINGKLKYLGLFLNEIEASEAYIKALSEL